MPNPTQLPMIRCNGISYRQGFIEVSAGILADHVNVEIWNVHPDTNISDLVRVDQVVSDNAFIGNTEVELTIREANALIESLRRAIQLAAGDEDKTR